MKMNSLPRCSGVPTFLANLKYGQKSREIVQNQNKLLLPFESPVWHDDQLLDQTPLGIRDEGIVVEVVDVLFDVGDTKPNMSLIHSVQSNMVLVQHPFWTDIFFVGPQKIGQLLEAKKGNATLPPESTKIL